MTSAGCEASAVLLAAQETLRQLQQQRRAERLTQGLPVWTDDHGRFVGEERGARSEERGARRELPEHLGWECARVTAVLREKQLPIVNGELGIVNEPESQYEIPLVTQQKNEINSRTGIRLFPDLALGMLRQGQVANGRLWLLLRHLDETGQGWVETAAARQHLTEKTSPLYVCGWRNVRGVLGQGEGIFWQVENGRIWLCSVAKVAAALQIHRLQKQPVLLPISILTQTIGAVRAHFYASFHSSHTQKPITRATLTKISQVSPRTQRRYDTQTKVTKRPNFAIGAKTTAENVQNRAWQHGQAVFQLADHHGKHGAAGATYVAWQLPNSYSGPHEQLSSSGKKRINRQLAVLLQQGTTGNGRVKIEKRFFGNGAAAAKVAGKQDVYWQGKPGFWYVIEP